MHHTELRDKVFKGTPSSVFQILAEPSVEVEARNSESRLKYGKNMKDNIVSINIIKVSGLRYLQCDILLFSKRSYPYGHVIAGMNMRSKIILSGGKNSK